MSRLVAYHAVLAAGTLCLGLSADVRASSCVWFPALAQDFERADRVFLALVTDRAEREQGGRTRAEATLEVLEVFKGEVAPVLHLAAYSKPFAGILELGETWLLFLPEQDWWPSVCSGNMPLADPRASTQLEVLRAADDGSIVDPWYLELADEERCLLAFTFFHGEVESFLELARGQIYLSRFRSESWATVHFLPVRPIPPLPKELQLTLAGSDFLLEAVNDRGEYWDPEVSGGLLKALLDSTSSSFELRAEGMEPARVPFTFSEETRAAFTSCVARLESGG